MADALGAGFRQSVWMVADELGFDLDPELRTTHEIAVATAPIDSPDRPDRAGLVAAQRFRWEGLVDGEPVITAAVNWLMGDAAPRSAVDVRAGGRALRGRGHRRSRRPRDLQEPAPALDRAAGLERNPGIVATAMHCVNAVPYVCAAAPGVLTYLDLPPVAGRAAARPGSARSAVVILDRFRLDGKVVDRHRRRQGDRARDRHRLRRGRRRRGRRRPDPGRHRGRRRRGRGPRPSGARRSSPTSCETEDLDALVERTVAELGRLDVLVNNAGGTPPRPGDGDVERGVLRDRACASTSRRRSC